MAEKAYLFASGMLQEQVESKACFFEKEQQKTFISAVADTSTDVRPREQKFFAAFFQKRSALLFL